MSFFTKQLNKLVILLSLDFVIYSLSIWLGICLRVGRWEPIFMQWKLMLIAGVTGLVVSHSFGIYRIVLRYMDERDILRILLSLIITTLMLSTVLYWFPSVVVAWMPRSVIVLFLLLAGFGIMGFRMACVLSYGGLHASFVNTGRSANSTRQKVVIYGAGESGYTIMSSLRKGCDYMPIGFIDDNPIFQDRRVSELPIMSRSDFVEFNSKHNVDIVLIAMPSASRAVKNEAISWLQPLGVVVKSLPNYEDITTGKVRVDEIQEVDIGDLLGRDKVEPNISLMRKNIRHKIVLITGAGGSIGSELCRQVLAYKPKVLILLDRSEYALYQIEQSVLSLDETLSAATEIVPYIGSVHDRSCLEDLFNRFKIKTVCHTAAYKHVPLVEQNLTQGIKNNVFGTLTLAEVAQQNKVDSFILISTDKAVRPTNFMGASKRLAELALKALHNAPVGNEYYLTNDVIKKHSTKFSMVRFGNVLDSSGSVIPKFRKQIKQGGPVTITDKKITRFFMTIPEAAELVIQAGAMAEGGEVYLLDMGDPVKIDDLARNLIQLSGMSVKDETNEDGDIEIVYTGLRPGEKLYEELLIKEESSSPTDNKRIFKAVDNSLSWDEYKEMLDKLECCLNAKDFNQLISLMEEYVEGFTHKGNCEDITWSRVV